MWRHGLSDVSEQEDAHTWVGRGEVSSPALGSCDLGKRRRSHKGGGGSNEIQQHPVPGALTPHPAGPF